MLVFLSSYFAHDARSQEPKVFIFCITSRNIIYVRLHLSYANDLQFRPDDETDVSPCSIARSAYKHQATIVTSLPMRLTQQTFGDNESNCEQVSESPHLSFSRVHSAYPVFF